MKASKNFLLCPIAAVLPFLLGACAGARATPAVSPPGPHAETPDFFADSRRASMMFLGTFHFQDAGLDSYRPQHHIDVRSPERQEEVEELMRLLAVFRPTHVAVEHPPFTQPRLDSLYREYRAGRWELGANEVYQLGFRLAARLGHDGVFAVDAERHPFFIEFWREHRDALSAADEGDAELDARYRELYRYSDALKMRVTLREYLLHLNDPQRILQSHGHNKIGSFKAEGESGFLGADAAMGWYSRNLRIFRNLQRITTSPDDRILVIIGSGHLPTLRFFADASPEYELVDVRRYLDPRSRGR